MRTKAHSDIVILQQDITKENYIKFIMASSKWTRVICLIFNYLWPPYVIGQAIYIFILWFLLSYSVFLA